MAVDTPSSTRNLVIYEVYVRNHGPHGSFADVTADLERIGRMGVDIVWLMPIHPIGQLNKKGSLGCPYSISDYRAVNPEYGTLYDFRRLAEKVHALGMRLMIDVVYNHTAHDSVLVGQHPDWFHQDANGAPVTTVPDWGDVIDLRHPNPALSQYLIETLQQWALLGVDGFRCDVASLLPEDFWTAARQAVAAVKPGVIWLAEAVHLSFIADRRRRGLRALSDSEVYRAFDLTYDYDIWPVFMAAVTGKMHFSRYLEMLLLQDAIYPANYVKMRCVENHDQLRIQTLAPTPAQALAWTAFEAFNCGAFLLYAGQESGAQHTPSLFDIDKIDWQDFSLQPWLTRLCALKKDDLLTHGQFTLLDDRASLQATWQGTAAGLLGIFNVQNRAGELAVPLADGSYTDELSSRLVTVSGGRVTAPQGAFILRYATPQHFTPFHSELF